MSLADIPHPQGRAVALSPAHHLAGAGLIAVAAALGVAAAAAPLEYTAALVATVVLVFSILREPRYALYLLVLAIPFSSLPSADLGELSVNATEPLCVLLAVSWLGNQLARRQLRIELTPLLIPLAGVLMAILASTFNSRSLLLSAKETAKWLELMLVYLFVTSYLRPERDVRGVFVAMFVAATAEALIGLVQSAISSGPAHFSVGPLLRAYGTFGQPNPFAGYLGSVLLPAAWLLLSRHDRSTRLLALLATIFTAAGVFASFSRGAWLGVGVAVIATAALWSRGSRRLLAPIVCIPFLIGAMFLAGALPPEVTQRLSTAVDYFGVFDVRTVDVNSDNWSLVQRMAFWQAAWQMFQDRPLFGIGAGNFQAVYEDYYLPGWAEHLGHAHNFYLNMLAETGILGLWALGLTFAIALYQAAAATLASPHDDPRRPMLIGVLGALIHLITHSLFDNLMVHGMGLQLGTLLGLTTALSRSVQTPALRARWERERKSSY